MAKARRLDPIAVPDTFELAVGGRDQLLVILQHGPQTPTIAVLMGLLADPRNDRKKLQRIAKEYNLDLVDLFQHFKDATLAKAQTDAVVRIASKLPDVAEDVFRRSMEHEAICAECKGSGYTAEGKECRYCQGAGRAQRDPDHEVQKTALKVGKLLEAAGGVSVNVSQTQQIGVMSIGQTMRQVQADTDKLLYPSRREAVIEADATPVEAHATDHP